MSELGILALSVLATGQPQPLPPPPMPQPDTLQAMRSLSLREAQFSRVIPSRAVTPPEFTQPDWSYTTCIESPASYPCSHGSAVERSSNFEQSLLVAENSYITTVIN